MITPRERKKRMRIRKTTHQPEIEMAVYPGEQNMWESG